MIDTIFSALEDIYFTVLTDTNPDSEETSTITLNSDTLNKTISTFKEIAFHQPYMASENIKFHLLEIATYVFNYIMHEDDGIFSIDEQDIIESYLKNKLTRFTLSEQEQILSCITETVTLDKIKHLVLTHRLPYRGLDMILDKIIDHVQNDERYYQPLQQIYSLLIEVKF